nr:immunoglobulin light chain junction region [Macaca mulatta]MOX71219.1 immunoglobulin light chain junction region [Macaca mulatta]MOX71670.1 immunoglobulin light chain junction region [Macaca mulatta]MOX72278.1 immunoglobulin light chain junction region [Macaca mulatta]MOX75320.1 immunoglobulin light chain junction region [Macaca mulatta]
HYYCAIVHSSGDYIF